MVCPVCAHAESATRNSMMLIYSLRAIFWGEGVLFTPSNEHTSTRSSLPHVLRPAPVDERMVKYTGLGQSAQVVCV